MKSPTRGTWAFHSIDGWYLSTSPEHYRTHRCHIKSTNSERLSDTVVFQHKSITHPSLTPTDKLMQAVSACAAALKGITAPTKDITDLKALLDITASTSNTSDCVPRHTTTAGPHPLPTNLAAANGVGGRIKGTNTIRFIRKRDIPKNRLKDITYGQFVCTVRPEKKEPNRTRLVVGGDRINYPGEVATPTADMLAAKILFNSVISTAKARFMTMDISNFYLNTPLKRPEYIRMKLSDIPEEIITEYKLRDLVEPDDCVYIIIVLGMYGLPHAGLIANELLEKRLNQHGYHQSKLVPGLWSHKWRPIWFTLVVDDFGVKYVGKEHALHLKSVLESYYPLSTDWTGNRYIGIRLDWDYNNRKVHLSMPGYKAKALKQFHHKPPSKPQHSPFPTKPIKYGAKKQYAAPPSTAPLLDKKGKKFIQQVCGKLLFLGRAVDSPLLCPISAIASQSAAPTQDTMTQTLQLLDYLATQEEAVLTYHASDMVLAAHSDASYLSEPQARSRAGGHFFLSSNADIPPNNGRSSTLPTSLNMSWRPPLKPNWPLCSLPPVKLSTYASYSWNLATSNPPHHSKPTMPWPKQSPMGKYNPSAPRPWTCASTGYAIANAKNNFEFTGALATAIMLITGPNITRPNIISTYAANSLHR
eukprot:CCRYP_003107-RA/>CCRYP_003107-RA protein AED:0.29 eAED:0.29 QI:0/0/0/1/1/1/2/0/642